MNDGTVTTVGVRAVTMTVVLVSRMLVMLVVLCMNLAFGLTSGL